MIQFVGRGRSGDRVRKTNERMLKEEEGAFTDFIKKNKFIELHSD